MNICFEHERREIQSRFVKLALVLCWSCFGVIPVRMMPCICRHTRKQTRSGHKRTIVCTENSHLAWASNSSVLETPRVHSKSCQIPLNSRLGSVKTNVYSGIFQVVYRDVPVEVERVVVKEVQVPVEVVVEKIVERFVEVKEDRIVTVCFHTFFSSVLA